MHSHASPAPRWCSRSPPIQQFQCISSHIVSRGWRSTHPLQADVAAKTVLEIAHLPLELVDLAPRRVDTFLAPRLQD